MHRQAAARFLVAHFNVALVAGNVITLKLTCYEFWDDYKPKKPAARHGRGDAARSTKDSHERQTLHSLQVITDAAPLLAGP
jgi:hypothetical protein